MGAVLAAVLPAVIGLLSNVLGIWLARRWERAGERTAPPYRLTAIDPRGWVSIAAVVLTAVTVAYLAGMMIAWTVAAAAVLVHVVILFWWGRCRMPLLTSEAQAWLWSWQPDNNGRGGLSYREELAGLAERTYTVQNLSRIDDLPAADLHGEVLSPDDLLTGSAHVLITGEAGVGKSTNLRQFGSAQARGFWIEATRRTAPVPGWLPILLPARDLVGKPSIEAALSPAPEKMLTRAPARNVKWLVLVDGVDEVLNAYQQQQVWELLQEAARTGGPFKLVISSRSVDPTRWRDLQYRDIVNYQLHPFTDEQLYTFAIRHQSGRPQQDEAARHAVERRAGDFVDHVRNNDVIEVVRLPLLAKLAADMYFDLRNGGLPMRLVDLYEHSIQQWLSKFDDALDNQVLQGISERERDDVHKLLAKLDEWDPAATGQGRAVVLRAFLTRLARILTDESNRDSVPDLTFTAADVLGVAATIYMPSKRLAFGRMLEAIGLIRDPYHDARFWHHTFAEYLAASESGGGARSLRCGHEIRGHTRLARGDRAARDTVRLHRRR